MRLYVISALRHIGSVLFLRMEAYFINLWKILTVPACASANSLEARQNVNPELAQGYFKKKSCSTQLSMKFQQLIKTKIAT